MKHRAKQDVVYALSNMCSNASWQLSCNASTFGCQLSCATRSVSCRQVQVCPGSFSHMQLQHARSAHILYCLRKQA